MKSLFYIFALLNLSIVGAKFSACGFTGNALSISNIYMWGAASYDIWRREAAHFFVCTTISSHFYCSTLDICHMQGCASWKMTFLVEKRDFQRFQPLPKFHFHNPSHVLYLVISARFGSGCSDQSYTPDQASMLGKVKSLKMLQAANLASKSRYRQAIMGYLDEQRRMPSSFSFIA